MTIFENTIANRVWEMLKSHYEITEETFGNYIGIDKDIAVSGTLHCLLSTISHN